MATRRVTAEEKRAIAEAVADVKIGKKLRDAFDEFTATVENYADDCLEFKLTQFSQAQRKVIKEHPELFSMTETYNFFNTFVGYYQSDEMKEEMVKAKRNIGNLGGDTQESVTLPYRLHLMIAKYKEDLPSNKKTAFRNIDPQTDKKEHQKRIRLLLQFDYLYFKEPIPSTKFSDGTSLLDFKYGVDKFAEARTKVRKAVEKLIKVEAKYEAIYTKVLNRIRTKTSQKTIKKIFPDVEKYYTFSAPTTTEIVESYGGFLESLDKLAE